MAQNFIACDREQPFLLPPDVRDWLPEDHLAWFVIDPVGVMDLAAFYAVEMGSNDLGAAGGRGAGLTNGRVVLPCASSDR